MLVNQPIPNLFNGVSQQPPQLRLPSQCEVMDNFYPTLATGLMKRPPSSYKAKINVALDANSFTTLINRDTTERYDLVIQNGSLQVFDATTGAQKTVTFPTGNAYLASTNPKKDFATVTIADHTFVVNRTKTVLEASAVSPANANVGYINFTYNGAGVKRTLSVTINTGSSTVTASASGDTTTQLSSLISTIYGSLSGSLTGWTVSMPFQNLIKIQRNDATPWSMSVSDDYGGSTMKSIKGSVQLFSDLPPQVDDGYICYITSRPTDSGKGYYVRYSAINASYIECPAQGIKTSIDASTMPHKLVRNADGTFTFTTFTWEPRKVGDDTSNPFPTFVGRTISDVFLYRNRLGFLADENACLSASGEYFNFGVKTATAVTDSDPIDVTVGGTKVSMLRFAVPFNKTLLLFSDQTQFQLSGGDTLTPRTVKADPVTEFACSSDCRPVGSGQELFFISNKPGYSGVREYYIQQDTLANDAADITAHVPSYIATGAFKIASSTSEDCLAILTETERNVLYAYKFFWSKEEKAQSAWFRFVFNPDDIILGADFIGSVLYLNIQRPCGVYMETINLQPGGVDTGLPFNVLLDRKVALQGVYNADTNETTWTLPWNVPSTGELLAVFGEAFGKRKATSIPLTGATSNTAKAIGKWDAGVCYVGVSYRALFRFSEQFFKDANNISVASARMKLRKMYLSYLNSGSFQVEVTPKGRDTNTYRYTGKVLGVSGVTLGSPSMSSGTFTFPIMTDSKGVRIDIINDGPLPSTFQGAEWDAEVVLMAKR